MFKIRDVRYKDILNIQSVDIPSAKISALFGESGCGKTTLMMLLNQLISYDDGYIHYKDRLITDIDPVELRRNVVMLSQTPAIFEGDIRENLLVGLGFSGKEDVEDAVLVNALDRVHLQKDLEEETINLSGGEKQRLAFARVILMDAEVFLMDEPTSALDEKTEAVVMDQFMEYVRKKNKTVVMVTHSRTVANRYSDQLIYMNQINRVGGA